MTMFCIWIVCFSIAQSHAIFHTPTGKSNYAEVTVDDFKFNAPGESAVYLISDGHTDVYYDATLDMFKASTAYTYRILVLKPDGFDLANVTIPLIVKGKLVTKQERLIDLKAITYSLSESGDYLEFEEISEDDLIKSKTRKNLEEVSFAMPKVKVNSIIDISYTIDSPFLGLLDDWYFQKDYPVRKSRYSVSIWKDFQYAFIMSGTLKIDEFQGEGQYYVNKRWTMVDIPAYKEEPLSAVREENISRLSLQLNAVKRGEETESFLKSWEEVTTDLISKTRFDQFYSGQRKIEMTLPIASKDSLEMAREIYEQFKTKFSWDNTYDIQPNVSIKEFNSKREGNSSAMGLALYRLFDGMGFDVQSVLSSPRSNGKLLKKYPLIDRLVVTLVRMQIGGKVYLLDPLNPVSFGLLDDELLNGEGIILGDAVLWQDLNLNANDYKTCKVEMSINPSQINTEIELELKDYGVIEQDVDLKSLFRQDWELTNVSVDRNELSHQKISASIRSEVDEDLMLIPIVFDQVIFDDSPFEDESRTNDIDFIYKKKYGYIIKVKLAPEFEFESVPQGRIVKTLDDNLSATLNVSQLGQDLNMTFLFYSKTNLFKPGHYHQIKEAYQLMTELAEGSIIVRRKS